MPDLKRVLLLVLGAHVVLKIALFPRAMDAPHQGDEVTYTTAATALANGIRALFSSAPFDGAATAAELVGYGWFMPGMTLVLTPLYLVDPDPSLAVTRAYLGTFTLLLLLLAVRCVYRTFGQGAAVTMAVVPGLLPMWVLYSYSAWGDLAAGLVVVVLVTYLVEAGRTIAAGNAPGLLAGARIGFLGAATLYLRSSVLPLVLGLLLLLLLAVVFLLRQRERLAGLASAVVAAGVLGALLLPWSYVASTVLDGPVITTSTVPLARAVTFGDTDRLCFGPPCGNGNIWVDAAAYSRQVARASGESEVTVQRQMADYALVNVTPRSYARDVLDNADRYALQPAGFEPVFREVPGSPPDGVSWWIVWTTQIGYFALLAAGVLALGVVTRRSVDSAMTSLVLKLSIAALFLQPFVHVSSPRYWPIFAPLMAVSVAWAAGIVSRAWASRETGADPAPPTGALRWLWRLQLLVVAALVLVPVALVAVAW